MYTRRLVITGILVLVPALAMSTPALAQRTGGGGGGRGGAPSLSQSSKSRLDTLDAAFTLTKDQKKAIRALLDDAHKSAAPVRDGLIRTRAAVAAAIQAGKGQADIDAAVKSYADQATAMTTIELKALADLMKALDPTQRANSAGISTAFFLLRGAFLDPKKWDDLPDGRLY